MIKQKRLIMNILCLLCAIGLIGIASVACTSSQEDTTTAASTDNDYLKKFKDYLDRYGNRLQMLKEQTSRIDRSIAALFPRYMKRPHSLDKLYDALCKEIEVLTHEQKTLDELYTIAVPDNITVKALTIGEVCSLLDQAYKGNNSIDIQRYQDMMREIYSYLKSNHFCVVNNSQNIDALDEQVSSMSLDQEMESVKQNLAIETLYALNYSVVVDIFNLIGDTSIGSWSELADEICKIIQARIKYDASRSEFILQLKNPDIYNTSITPRAFCVKLDTYLPSLVADNMPDNQDTVLIYLADLLNLSEANQYYLKSRLLKSYTISTFVDALFLHATLCKNNCNNAADVKLVQEIIYLAKELTLDQLIEMQSVIKMIECSEEPTNSSRSGLIERLTKSNPAALLNTPEKYDTLRWFIMTDGQKISDVLHAYIEETRQIYQEFLDGKICIGDIKNTTSSLNAFIVELVSDTNDAMYTQTPSKGLSSLVEDQTSEIRIAPVVFGLGPQIVRFYNLLKSRDYNKPIIIELTAIQYNPAESLLQHHKQLEVLRFYLNTHIRGNNTIITSPVPPVSPSIFLFPDNASKNSILFKALVVIFIACNIFVSSILNTSTVLTVFPLALIGVCTVKAILSSTRFNHTKPVQWACSILAYSLLALLSLHTFSLLLVTFDKVLSAAHIHALTCTILNLPTLGMLYVMILRGSNISSSVEMLASTPQHDYLAHLSYLASFMLAWIIPFLYAMDGMIAVEVCIKFEFAFLSAIFLFCGIMLDKVIYKHRTADNEEEKFYRRTTNHKRRWQIITMFILLSVISAGIIGSVILTYRSNTLKNTSDYIHVVKKAMAAANDIIGFVLPL